MFIFQPALYSVEPPEVLVLHPPEHDLLGLLLLPLPLPPALTPPPTTRVIVVWEVAALWTQLGHWQYDAR